MRLGYNQAMRQNRQYLGFLMILMQRLVTSSTQAIASALERRLEALQATNLTATDEEPPETNLDEQDSQEQLEELLAIRLAGLQNEKEEVQAAARSGPALSGAGAGRTGRNPARHPVREPAGREQPGVEVPDLHRVRRRRRTMLRDFLEQHGFSVVCLNGSMDLEERRRVQRQFAEKARILVSTDAGGEGLNLQFAHVVINYDLPWNPMRIEQRIGRVDRIGQKLPVKAFNLIFEDSVELRVQEVLEEKLATILDEFGVDKTQDVLDSAESGAIFEKLYAQAILNPGDIEKNIDRLIAGRAGTGAAGNRRAVVLRRNRAGPDAGPAVEQPPVAVLGRTDGDGVPAMRRRQGAAGLVQLHPGVARWQPDGAGVVPQPGGPGPRAAARQPGRRPDSSPRTTVAPCRRHRADSLRARLRACPPRSSATGRCGASPSTISRSGT